MAYESGTQRQQLAGIVTSFAQRYYTVGYTDLGSLHRFYDEKSTLMHGGANPIPESDVDVIGIHAIQEKFRNHEFRFCSRVELTIVDFQPSFDGSIVISVYGIFFSQSIQPRRFTQIFVLVPSQNGSYFIRNDIFRFLDELSPVGGLLSNSSSLEQVHHKAPQKVPSPQLAPQTVPVIQTHEETVLSHEVEEPLLPEPVKVVSVPKTAPKQQNKQKNKANTQSTTTDASNNNSQDQSNKQNDQNAEENKPKVPEGPKTWASLLGAKTPAPVQQEVVSTPAPAQQKKYASEEKESQHKHNRSQQSGSREGTGTKSIFVTNFDQKTDLLKLAEFFKKFGPVKNQYFLQVAKSAIIEFEDEASAASVLNQAHTLEYHGSFLRVEPRRNDYNRTSVPRVGGGPGRGGARPVAGARGGENDTRRDRGGRNQS